MNNATPTPTLTLKDAFAVVDAALRAGSGCAHAAEASETVPVRDARGRVLLVQQVSSLDLPPFDKSAMDGFAIRQGDERAEYRLLETVAAGATPTVSLEPGTTVKVMTGAPVPDGTGRVVKREDVEENGRTIRVLGGDRQRHICPQGEDVRAGEPIMPAGRRLTAVDVANLLACGVTQVPVARAVRLAVISTGDEIVDDPSELRPGQIVNANGPLLAGLAAAGGLTVAGQWTVADDLAATAGAIRQAMAGAELVVVSGGVSEGDFDYVLGAMAEAGLHVHFTRLAVKPGRPTVFATAGGEDGQALPLKVVFGLPGNPVSVCLMFHLFVLRAAAILTGRVPELPELRLPLAAAYRRRNPDRLQFVPARLLADEDGTTGVQPLECHGSGDLLAMSKAQGFFRAEAGVAEIPAGSIVSFLPLLEDPR
jgi:molybdopterin molybdotransferase